MYFLPFPALFYPKTKKVNPFCYFFLSVKLLLHIILLHYTWKPESISPRKWKLFFGSRRIACISLFLRNYPIYNHHPLPDEPGFALCSFFLKKKTQQLFIFIYLLYFLVLPPPPPPDSCTRSFRLNSTNLFYNCSWYWYGDVMMSKGLNEEQKKQLKYY